nr:serine/arginine-rich splicing factor SR45-like [Equus asinus]
MEPEHFPPSGQPARPHPAAPAARAGGGGRRRRLLSRRRWWPDGLVQRLQPTPFKGTRAAASRVAVPRSPPSPPPPRHESGFLPRHVAESCSPSPHLGLAPGPRRPTHSQGCPSPGKLRGPRKAGGPHDRCCLLCGVVVAAMRSPRPSTGRGDPAGQMLQLFAVNCPSFSSP